MGLLIDKQLVFDEDNFLLFRLDTTGEEPLRVGAIASRCLAMLLRSDGSVVRKRDLMSGAWGQYGLEVTDNSLAQVVRQLRLALEKLQPDRDFIQTLPRIGYKLSDGVRVEEWLALPASGADAAENAASIDDAPLSNPVDRVEEGVRAPMAPTHAAASACPVPSQRRWGLWLALPVWGALAFLLGTQGWGLPDDAPPPEFTAPVTVEDVHVHRSAQDAQTLTAPHLQRMVGHSRKLAGLLELSAQNIHLYLLPSRRGADQILCDGELESTVSRCIGVQQHD
ncbi:MULTISPECIES: transcriptional regulator [unclassified Pseudomonas]|jgi:DNA-binding winged helix-turn-helix (wHTH) protein|uniref:transcriptional regulator n=1 Tax=unclassified Pseudomonas TaxID=196821 RepID=UPI000BA37F6B|nr:MULTISPECIES: winged helix-turn-helix domain-containing protein [unclassified Pseudomonas]MDN4543902.1 winged helix-turn-helix domain-containing protein [Pseudomonas sp. C32]